MAYEQIEPFGETRADLRMAILAATTVNVHKGKKGKSAKPKDFMPEFYKPKKKEMGWQAQLAHIETVNQLMGGKDNRHGDIS